MRVQVQVMVRVWGWGCQRCRICRKIGKFPRTVFFSSKNFPKAKFTCSSLVLLILCKSNTHLNINDLFFLVNYKQNETRKIAVLFSWSHFNSATVCWPLILFVICLKQQILEKQVSKLEIVRSFCETAIWAPFHLTKVFFQ